MNGQLSDQPLAELIHEISEARLSGALRLSHERVRGAVYFEGGQVVAALTNLRAYRLAELVRRERATDEARLGEVLKEGMSDEQAGIALVRSGALTEGELRRLQDRQSAEVLRLLLRWPEGDWSFDARVRFAGEYRARVDAPQLLLEGARRLPPERVSARMNVEAETISPSGDEQARIDGGLQLLPTEAFVLTRVYEPMRLSDLLVLSGLPSAEALRAIYALTLGGLLRREGHKRTLTPETVKQAQAQPQAAAQEAPAQVEEVVKESEPQQQPAAQTEAAEQDPREGMEELFERSRGATHFEVLGVSRSAKPEELKRVYYALARRLHPDRFRRFADDAMRMQIDLAFAKIAQAYEILKDSKLRAAYELKLSSMQPSQPAQSTQPESFPRMKEERAAGSAPHAEEPQAPPALSKEDAHLYRAEELFQRGVSALQQRQHPLALRYFGEAALLAPKQARYRAYYGRALGHEKQTRRQAEAELQAAVSLDEKNASYRVMLAELYIEIGLRRRAERELEQALALDPQHAQARRLLGELRARG